jgi:hypothetical protein
VKQADYAALTSVVTTKQAEAIMEFFRKAEQTVSGGEAGSTDA